MRDDGIATTVMLGLSGFRVLAVSEYDGEVEQAVETTADGAGARPWGFGRGCMIDGRRRCGIYPRPVGR